MMDAGGRPATGRGCVQLVLGPMFRYVCRLRRTKNQKGCPRCRLPAAPRARKGTGLPLERMCWGSRALRARSMCKAAARGGARQRKAGRNRAPASRLETRRLKGEALARAVHGRTRRHAVSAPQHGCMERPRRGFLQQKRCAGGLSLLLQVQLRAYTYARSSGRGRKRCCCGWRTGRTATVDVPYEGCAMDLAHTAHRGRKGQRRQNPFSALSGS